MTVSPAAPVTPMPAAQIRQEIDVAVARKALDQMKQQGRAALSLLEGAVEVQRGTAGKGGGRVDVYA